MGVISRFNTAPTEAHLTAAKRVLHYLKGTIDFSLQYKRTENAKVIGFSDADWASDMDNHRSTTGNVFMMSSGPIICLSQKQATVILSTATAEYITLSSASQEAVLLPQLLSDLGESYTDPTAVMEDNQGAIAMAKNPIGHKRAKYVDIRYHFVRELTHTHSKIIEITYCSTKEMIADIFTKPLVRG